MQALSRMWCGISGTVYLKILRYTVTSKDALWACSSMSCLEIDQNPAHKNAIFFGVLYFRPVRDSGKDGVWIYGMFCVWK